jgi:hypothetical protein
MPYQTLEKLFAADAEPFRNSRCNRLAQIVLYSRCDGVITGHGTHRGIKPLRGTCAHWR